MFKWNKKRPRAFCTRQTSSFVNKNPWGSPTSTDAATRIDTERKSNYNSVRNELTSKYNETSFTPKVFSRLKISGIIHPQSFTPQKLSLKITTGLQVTRHKFHTRSVHLT